VVKGGGTFVMPVVEKVDILSLELLTIDVQTPTDENHVPMYESLREVTEGVGKHMRRGTLVVIESTVAPGTTDHVVKPLLEKCSGMKAGEGFFLAYLTCFSIKNAILKGIQATILDYPEGMIVAMVFWRC
jgi:UDP-N-acetyl-D-mannosaminuronate dehydrogenase